MRDLSKNSVYSEGRANLLGVFYRVIAFFPFMMACLLGLRVIFGLADSNHYFLPFFNMPMLAFVVVALVIVAFTGACGLALKAKGGELPRLLPLLLIALLALALRVGFIMLYGQRLQPFSDFLWAYEAATGVDPHVFRYQIYPTWGFYAWAMELLFQVVPASHVTVQVLNAAMQSVSVALLYALANVATRNKNVALIASASYALNPTAIAYCMLLSPEIPAITLFLASATLGQLALQSRASLPRAFTFAIASGVMLGLAGWFKPVAPLFIAALVVSVPFLKSYRDAKALAAPTSRRNLRAYGDWVASALLVVVLALSCAMVNNAFEGALEDRLGATVVKSSVPLFLWPGMHHDGEGQLHLGENPRLHLEAYERLAPDFDSASDLVMRAVVDDLSNNLGAIPNLIAHKLLWAWQSDVQVFSYAQLQIGPSDKLGFLSSLAQWYYIAVMGFAAVGGASLARNQRRGSMTFVSAIIFGFFILLLISEAQSRYKVLVMPLITIASAIGMIAAQGKALRFLEKRKRWRCERGVWRQSR